MQESVSPGRRPSSPTAFAPPESLSTPDRSRSPPTSAYLSAPIAFASPMRHHRRTPSQHREIKETLDAVSQIGDEDDDGTSLERINQYILGPEIGRGSYGAVRRATDQFGRKYAVKQFSKLQMQRRARSDLMRRLPYRGPNRMESQKQAEAKDALFYIRREVAIMKKLNHPNLVELIEVLDDPEQDSLYMVLEMCEKGVIMSVDLNKPGEPRSLEECRLWFRDLILGIEYLHKQHVVHRDIKPDNLLLTSDNVLKIADFGVSEMFEKDDMRTAKAAGSPAFLAPELCGATHGEVSGTACDIWSMGVTLYCLRYGKIPFSDDTLPGVYEAILHNDVEIPEGEDADFVDLIHRLLEKNPDQRITMDKLREHPWVTKSGTDTLLSTEENCADPIEPPNALEINHAFTRDVGRLIGVFKAISKFKSLLQPKSQAASREAPSPESPKHPWQASSYSASKEEARLVIEDLNLRKASLKSPIEEVGSTEAGGTAAGADNTPPLVLGIGVGGADDFGGNEQHAHDGVVSESPTQVDFDVYSSAFRTELRRLRSQRKRARIYLNKQLERRGTDAIPEPDLETEEEPSDR